MRIRHSLKAIIPFILWLSSTQSVQAQGGPPMQGMPMPGAPMAGPQQVPGSYGMYPYESPYQGMFEQTYQRDGTWFKNSVNGFGPNNRPRQWFMTLDYTRTRNPKMKGLFGAEGVPSYLQLNDPDSNEINPGNAAYNYFDAVHADIIPKLSTNGIKLSGGFWNPDDSGFLFSGGFQFQNEQDYDARAAALAGQMDTATALAYQRDPRGTGQVFNLGGRSDLDYLVNDILAPGSVFDSAGITRHGVSGTTRQILDRTLLNLHSLPTYSGRTPFQINGEAAPYDVQFRLKQSISTGGVNADWAFSPVYDNDRIKIRPVVGGRWFWINETMDFDGVSTLLNYTSRGATADGNTPPNAKVFLPNTGVAPITTTIGVYNAPTTGANNLQLNDLLVYSYIKSQVVTNLYGPEFGFHYEMGRKKGIQFSGATRAAVMFNSETLRLSGDNIGNFMGVEILQDPITGVNTFGRLYNTSTRQGPSLNAFRDVEVGTHISPLFEQTFTAEIPIFDRVPVLRNVDILEEAKLSIGWTGLVIGEISDPNKSINYTSSPVSGEFLSIKPGHTNFIQNTLNVGVNWNY